MPFDVETYGHYDCGVGHMVVVKGLGAAGDIWSPTVIDPDKMVALLGMGGELVEACWKYGIPIGDKRPQWILTGSAC